MSIEIARTRAGEAVMRACIALTLMFLLNACSQITSARTTCQPMKSGEMVTQRVLLDDESPTSVSTRDLNPKYMRQRVHYLTSHPAGTIVVDPDAKFLYLVMEGGAALRYGIGVGREGFGWSGEARIARKARWPSWTPPAEMIRRQPASIDTARACRQASKTRLALARCICFRTGEIRFIASMERMSLGALARMFPVAASGS